MKKDILLLNEIKLVGIKVRTNNKTESNPATGVIPACVNQYHQQQIAEKIQNRKIPGITFCAYTDYASDHQGDYTFFIGEEVLSLDNVSTDLEVLVIPPQVYAKFTTDPGVMPQVVINAWQAIWRMTAQELGGNRRFIADFEMYDQRASDPQNTVLDIYIGINK